MCGKKQHTKAEIRSEMSELICGRIAAGENYNLTRDSQYVGIMLLAMMKKLRHGLFHVISAETFVPII